MKKQQFCQHSVILAINSIFLFDDDEMGYGAGYLN